MPVHNVSETHHDHICIACGATEQQRPHEKLERVEVIGGIVLVIECANGHRECFNNNLPAWEETSETRNEASREQVRNVRLLYKHYGKAGKDEKQRNQDFQEPEEV